MTDLGVEMSLFDRMHPRCRAAIANAPYNFNLTTMPRTAICWAAGAARSRPEPSRFLAWLDGEIGAARDKEAHS